jgi:hypothetical protein
VLLLALNTVLYLYFLFITSPYNYLWGLNADEFSVNIVKRSCQKLLFIELYTYCVPTSMILLGFFWLPHFPRLTIFSFAYAFLAAAFAMILLSPFKPGLYHAIFVHQSVTADFVLEPIKSAGKNIGPYLVQDVKKGSRLALPAAEGLGLIKYAPATSLLSNVASNRKNRPILRAKAYLSLKNINTEEALESCAVIVKNNRHPSDIKMLEYIKRLELQGY